MERLGQITPILYKNRVARVVCRLYKGGNLMDKLGQVTPILYEDWVAIGLCGYTI